MSPCPSKEEFGRLLAEQLNGPQREAVEAHVETCAACQTLLALLAADPAWVGLVRPSNGRTHADDELAANFLRDLKQSPPPLGRTAPDSTLNQPVAELSGTVIGPYRLLQQIGEGGMGVVYMAEQTQPVQRKVALKVIKPGMDSRQVIARFEVERQALAMMDHVNIARVLDAGTTGRQGDKETRRQGDKALPSESVLPVSPSPHLPVSLSDPGRPYFVMELVHGVPITKYCDDNQLTPRERLELFVPVCQAIQHAHQKGIIHRDIKPSNVMITLYDGKPVPKVIDFGVAKATDQKLTERTLFTQYGAMVGTLEYMSPEQAEMSALGVDTRSDIYSLGALLYELLTGSTPLSRKRVKEAAYGEVLRMIREEEAPKPSTRLSDSGAALPSISAQRHMEPAKLTKLVRGELDWIVMKTLEKDRNRRYETANGFAADLQRYLNDEAVQACPPSAAYRLRKFVRRNKGPVLAASLVLLALVTGIAVSTWQAIRATRAEDSAVLERDETEKARQQAVASESKATEAAEAERQAKVVAQQAGQGEKNARERAEEKLARQYENVGVQHINDGDLLAALPWLAEAFKLDRGNLVREEVHRLRLAAVLEGCPKLVHLWSHENPVTWVEFSADGRGVVTASADGAARVWDADTGRLVRTYREHRAGWLRASFSPDGRRLLTINNGADDYTANVLDVDTGRLVFSPLTAVDWAFFSPDGLRLVTRSGNTARVWDAATGQPVTPPIQHNTVVNHVAFSPDSRLIVTATGPMTARPFPSEARVWDAGTGQPVTPSLQHVHGVPHASFRADGRQVVTACSDHSARVWDVATGALVTTLGPTNRLKHAEFSPDGRRVVTAGGDNVARVWDVATAKEVTPPLKHGTSVNHAAFSTDGRLVVTAGTDGTARVWNAATGAPLIPPLDHSTAGTRGVLSRDGNRIATVSSNTVRLWDIRIAAPAIQLHDCAIYWASFSPDGRRVITSGGYNSTVWDAATGTPLTPLMWHRGAVLDNAFSPDGRHVLTRGEEGTGRLWDAATGAPVTAPFELVTNRTSFSPDGRHILVVASGVVRLRDVSTGESAPLDLKQAGWVNAATFSPDGRHIITLTGTAAQVWNAATWRPVGSHMKHTHWIQQAAFSPDGRSIVTASDDSTARVWDAATGSPLTPPLKHGSGVNEASFSPDSKQVLTASNDGMARVWDARTGAPLTPMKHLGGQRAAFSPDGGRIVTAGGLSARVWHAATAQPISLPLKAPEVSIAWFSPDGRRILTRGWDWAYLWDLPREDGRPVEDLLSLTQLLSGRQIDSAAGAVPVEPAVLAGAWHTLRPKYLGDFVCSPRQVLGWHQQAAETLLSLEHWSAAIPHLDALVAAGPTRWKHHGDRARAHGALKEWAKAIADYSQALELVPAGWPFWEPCGLPSNLLEDPNRTVTEYTQAIELGAKHWRVWSGRGGAHARAGKLEQAAADYAKAAKAAEPLLRRNFAASMKLVADFPAREDYRDRLFQSCFALAHFLNDTGRPNEVEQPYYEILTLCEKLADKFPTAPEHRASAVHIRFHMCYMLMAAGRPHDAVTVSKKLVDEFPLEPKYRILHADACGKRGGAHAALEQWDKAAADFAKVIELKAEDPLPRYRLALVYLHRGDKDKYRTVCAGMLERFGQSPDLDPAYWTSWTCALAPYSVADWQPVVQLAEKTLAADPKSYDKMNHFGAVLYRAGRLAEAAKHLTAAETAFKGIKAPRSSIIYTWLFQAMTEHRLGHAAEARKWLEKAVQEIERPAPVDPPAAALPWNRRLTLQLLRREAEELLKQASGIENQGSETKQTPH